MSLISSLERGGPLEQALVLAPALAEHGVEVQVVCASTQIAERFEAQGIPARAIFLRHATDLASARRIRRVVRGADVVHAQDRRSGLWVCLSPPPGERGARVYTIHGLPDPFLPEPARRSPQRLKGLLAYRLFEARLCRRAEALLVPSRALAERLGELSYPSDRMHVVPNGVPVPPELGGGELIGSISVLEPVKGLDSFLEAAAMVAERRPEARFAVFGEGSELDHLAARSRAIGLADRLELPGHVPAERALSSLRIFVLCSHFENSPMALLEAMAAGIPAIATSVGGVPELVDGTVELLEPGRPDELADAIERLLDDPNLARERAKRARERVVERYSATENAAATVGVYEAALAGRSR